MSIGDILHNKRKQLGLTLEEVGNAVGVSKSTVRKWETGYIANIKRDKIANLAKILQINPVVLIQGEESESPKTEQEQALHFLPQSNIRSIPIFESVAAGFGAVANAYPIDYMPLYIENDNEANETICVTVKGDSMYPKIEDGDLIQVRKQDSVDSGKIAVVLIDGEDTVVKKVVYDSNTIQLISINPEYAPRIFSGREVMRLRILGLVRKIIKSVD